MGKQAELKLKTFEVVFKEYYHELSDWTSENIRATNERDALRSFAKRHGLRPMADPTTWEWYEGDWQFAFRQICLATMQDCLSCGGSGKVPIHSGEKGTRFGRKKQRSSRAIHFKDKAIQASGTRSKNVKCLHDVQ
jgi:hypothetical protein